MKKALASIFFIFLLLTAFAQVSVSDLRCEYRNEPLGVESTTPVLSWILYAGGRNIKQTAYRILVSENEDDLVQGKANCWDSKKIVSSSSISIKYAGKPLEAAKKYFWKLMVWDNNGKASAWSKTASWQMGLLTKADWKFAHWIAYSVLPDSNIIIPFAHGRGKKEWGARKNVLPYFRKEFTIEKPVKRATAFISGLGHFIMTLNGEKVGDHFLDPGWTQYSKEALYVTFDITKMLNQGDNAVGVQLGNGFYYIPGERYRKLTGAYGNPKMISRIYIEYTDGSTTNIVSNERWKTSPSPVTFSSIYGGEDYDAGLEKFGWNRIGLIDYGWENAIVTEGPPSLISQMAEPLKELQKFRPVNQQLIKKGLTVYDLGQNFSGIPSISVQGKSGDTIRIIPAELLNEDGTANQRGSGGPHFYNYIINESGKGTWQPSFTFYGFRYLQVHCIAKSPDDDLPVVNSIEGIHIRNAAPATGSFQCSNQLFNKTFDLINWAIRSNTMSVFTDCPHREKLGWLEETHLMGSSVQFNYDIAALCKKVVRDMQQAQTNEGLIPEIAPEFVEFEEPFRDSPEWGSAAVILPWYMYKWYGDVDVLTTTYGMMKKYMSYLGKKANGHILTQGLGDWYDIGPNRPGVSQLTPAGVTATAIYYYDLSLLTKIATVIGKTDDALTYNKIADSVKIAFNDKFFDRIKFQYASGSQTANAIALYAGLVDSKYQSSVLNNLISDIKQRKFALTAGDIGYRYVLRVLEDAGRSDIIYSMNNRDDVPGYGYQLAHGATALTESWQAYPSVSNNHFMLGHLMEWFYGGLAGIKMAEDGKGYDKIEIYPQTVGEISFTKAHYLSMYGRISSEWKKNNGGFELKVEIPVNSSAVVYLPALSTTSISEGGKPVSSIPGIKMIGKRNGRIALSVGSGKYNFKVINK